MIRLLALGLSVVTFAAPASAQSASDADARTYPNRTVRIVVPFPPGGPADLIARFVGQKLSEDWGQPVVIENRPGGDGIVAIGAFVAAVDDHQLLYCPTGSFTAHPYLHANLPYDAKLDLLPIARVTSTIIAVGVPASPGAADRCWRKGTSMGTLG
jgi:tripartite-type tricarboxylate transporter receptor subunit TctC